MLNRFVLLWLVLGGWIFVSFQTHAVQKPFESAQISDGTKKVWRYTGEGWKKITIFKEDSVQAPEPPAVLHPVVWTLFKLFLLASAIAWASSEWEWSQFTRALKRLCRIRPKYRQPVPGIEDTTV